MRIFYIIVILNLIGCKSAYREVSFRYNKTNIIKLNIPNGFVFEGLQGDHELEYRYWYSDSSLTQLGHYEIQPAVY